MSDYYERERAEAAARKALCDALPAALEKATGESWSLSSLFEIPAIAAERAAEEAADIRHFSGAAFVRDRDGFTITVSGPAAWNKRDRMEGRIRWPRNPGDKFRAGRTLYREAPGVAYDAGEPGTSFAVNRPADAVAKQIARELVKPDYDEARAGLLAKYEAEAAREAEAGRWIAAVSEAAGVEWRDNPSTGESYFRTYKTWVDELTSRGHGPGGKLRLDLPADPEKAAALVAGIRALVEESK